MTPEDNAAVTDMRRDIAWQTAALEIAGVRLSDRPSEAEALHALLEVGRVVVAERVNEKAMESGYAALAATRVPEDLTMARATGRRTAQLPD